MLFLEAVVVYSENHRKLVNSLCGENGEISNVKEFAAYGNNVLRKLNYKCGLNF
jgi:hypothetical protein